MYRNILILLYFASMGNQTEVIETVCHRLKINNVTNTTTSGSCQCKDGCGGSLNFTYTLSPTYVNYTRWISSLAAAGQLDDYPKWIITALEENVLFRDKCKCGLYGNWSTFAHSVFDSFTVNLAIMLTAVFNPASPFISIKLAGISSQSIAKLRIQWTADLLFPILLLFSLFNVAMALKLYNKEATAFTFQVVNYVSSFFALLANSMWLRMTFNLFFLPDQTWFSTFLETFLCCCQLMSFCLMADRCLAVLKPFFYKNHASPKKAFFICFFSFLFSFLLSSAYLAPTTGRDKYSVLFIIASFTLATVYCFIVLFELVALAYFLILTKKTASETTQQLKLHQRNINFILLSSAVVESLCGTCYMMFDLIEGAIVLADYNIKLELLSFYLALEGDFKFARSICISMGPFMSLAFCITFSKTYRKAFYSLLTCKLFKGKGNSVGSSQTQTKVTRIDHGSTKSHS